MEYCKPSSGRVALQAYFYLMVELGCLFRSQRPEYLVMSLPVRVLSVKIKTDSRMSGRGGHLRTLGALQDVLK